MSRGNLVLVNLFGSAIDLFDYLINIVKHLVQLQLKDKDKNHDNIATVQFTHILNAVIKC